MDWNEDALDYGYVVYRPAAGGWWHLHIGRAAWSYDCRLLGRRTNLFVRLQYLGVGANPLSPAFTLTLDGEGLETSLWLNCTWSEKADEARQFQEEIMPLLYESDAMQNAMASVIHKGRHLCLIGSEWLKRDE